MLKYLFLLFGFLSILPAQAQKEDPHSQIIICSDSRFKCYIINRLPLEPDGKFIKACCHHMRLNSDWDCTDDCVSARLAKDPSQSSSGAALVDGVLVIDGEPVGELADSYPRVNSNLSASRSFYPDFPLNFLSKSQSHLVGKDLVIDGEIIGNFPTAKDNSPIEFSEVTQAAKTNKPSGNLEAQTVTIFPNPVVDILSVSVPSSFRGHTILIYDQNGKEVHRSPVSTEQNVVEVNVGTLPVGLYTLLTVGDKSNQTIKFVKK
ncbi:T9SS type A sorting domain-containing protein [Neolewinella aurantiaca]|uniref:T9SS type A sorting domain-containing protein n=1 Tax=Neolewinella aurantiaca TaxID=2602767 RepID=A0A5C7FM72_9BACT|nr:T9SS type A sorting domain-containing protein [Neolewinella aurantiaca]TXF88512.1 T9SS type A sorting domain-containing protein [Neolewinella aurantiaca]